MYMRIVGEILRKLDVLASGEKLPNNLHHSICTHFHCLGTVCICPEESIMRRIGVVVDGPYIHKGVIS